MKSSCYFHLVFIFAFIAFPARPTMIPLETIIATRRAQSAIGDPYEEQQNSAEEYLQENGLLASVRFEDGKHLNMNERQKQKPQTPSGPAS